MQRITIDGVEITLVPTLGGAPAAFLNGAVYVVDQSNEEVTRSLARLAVKRLRDQGLIR